jgi:hypothetical protein
MSRPWVVEHSKGGGKRFAPGLVTPIGGMSSAIGKSVAVEELHSNQRPDLKAVVFLVITLGLAALELWGLVRLF